MHKVSFLYYAHMLMVSLNDDKIGHYSKYKIFLQSLSSYLVHHTLLSQAYRPLLSMRDRGVTI